MNQLLFTSCRQRRSVSGQSGFQIRAATSGFEPTRQRAAMAYVGYKLPDTIPPTADAVPRAPVRLALIDTPELGRALLHSVYVGQEGQGTRGGNFFTHLVVDLPDDFDPGSAAGLWGDPFWRVADGDDIDLVLPESKLPTRKMRGGFAPQVFTADPGRRALLQFVLDAVSVPAHAGKRIYLAAHPQDIAGCVHLAALALPREMANRLTFSTYEYAPLTARTLIVGADVESDLPAPCYSGSGLGFHCRTGHKTDLGGSSRYAKYAISLLVKGQEENVRRFAAWFDKHGVNTPELLDCGFHVATKQCDKLTPDQINLALGPPLLAAQFLALPGIAVGLTPEQMDRALGDQAVAKALVEHTDVVERLADLASKDATFHLTAVPKLTRYLIDARDGGGADPVEGEGLSEKTRCSLAGWRHLAEMEAGAQLDPDSLTYAGKVLAAIPEKARMKRAGTIIRAVATAMGDSNRTDLVPTVEAALTGLIPQAPSLVYAKLCEHFAERAAKQYRPAPLVALIAVGLGQCKTDDLAKKLGDDGKAAATNLLLALKAAKRWPMLEAIRGAGNNWSKKPKKAIRRLLPPSLLKRLFNNKWVQRILLLAILGVIGAGVYLKKDAIMNVFKSE